MKPKKELPQPKRRRLNYIDWLLLALLVLLTATVVLRVLSIESSNGGTADTAVISFRTDTLPREVAEMAKKETEMLVEGSYPAVLLELASVPDPVEVISEGEIRYLPSTLHSHLVGKLRVSGKAPGNGFFLGGRLYFVPGVSAGMTGSYTTLRFTVTDILFEKNI